MKKVFMIAFLFTICSLQMNAQVSKSTTTKSNLEILKAALPNCTFTLISSSPKDLNTTGDTQRRRVLAEYSYCNCETGEWGTATVSAQFFLGIQISSSTVTYTVIGGGCSC